MIAVENQEPQATFVIDLVNAHRQNEIEVALLAASASENDKSKLFPGNAAFFKERVKKLGWDDLPIVPMPGIFGLSYIDFCFFVGDNEAFERDVDALWQVIAPNVPQKPSDHLADGQQLNDETIQSYELSKWRNTWCDVISAYSHIHAGRDIYVTNNTSDFQRKARSLANLGMEQIATPANVRNLIKRLEQVAK